jgi:hypothetical protein
MAQLNQEATAAATSNGRIDLKPSHYVNISVVKSDGSTMRLGAIAIIPEKADITQRTLIQAFKNGVDVSQFAIKMEVRSAEKSTEVDDIDSWATTKVVEVD